MAVISALRRIPGALTRNPIIFVVFGLFGLVQVPQLLAQVIDPVLAGLLSLVLTGVYFLLVPFIQAGVMQMADEALDGRTSLGAFVAAGKENYLSVFGAYLVVFGISFVLGIVGFIVALFGGAVAIGSGQGLGTTSLVLLALVVGVIVLVYLVFAFFVQFYVQEIVLRGASAIGSLKRSAGLVRNNLLSTFGYFVVVMVGSGLFGAAIGVLSVFVLPSGTETAMATPSLTMALVSTVATFVGTAVMGSIFSVYAVSFWRELRGGESSTGPAEPITT